MIWGSLKLLQKLPIHKSIDYYVPTKPMIIHDFIIEINYILVIATH